MTLDAKEVLQTYLDDIGAAVLQGRFADHDHAAQADRWPPKELIQ